MRYAPTGCVCTAGTSDFRRSFPAEIFSVGVDKLSGFFGFFRRSGNRPNAHDEGVLLMHPHSQNALLSLFGNGIATCVWGMFPYNQPEQVAFICFKLLINFQMWTIYYDLFVTLRQKESRDLHGGDGTEFCPVRHPPSGPRLPVYVYVRNFVLQFRPETHSKV